VLSLQTHPGVDTTAQLLFSLKPPSESFKTDAGSARFDDYLTSYSTNDNNKTASLNEDELAGARKDDKAADPKSTGDLDAEEGKVVEEHGTSGEGKDIFLSAPHVFPQVNPEAGIPAEIGVDGVEETVILEEDSAGGAILGGIVPEIDGTEKIVADLGAVIGTDATNQVLGEEAAAREQDLGESSIALDARRKLSANTENGESLQEPALRAETGEAELEAASKMVTQKKAADNEKDGFKAEDVEKKAAPDAVSVKKAQEVEGLQTGQLSVREGRQAGQKNTAQPKTAQRPEAGAEAAAAVPETAGNPAAASGGEAAGMPSVELTVSADVLSAAQSEAASTTYAAGKTTGSAATGAGRGLFSPEAQNALNGDIVRHANIMLRSGGEGLIRLSLKPESLGNVKIRLHLAENKISGQIIVETAEALKAFEQQVHELEKSLAAQGYDSAKLEMSLAQNSNGGQQPENGETWTASSGRAAALYDKASDCIETKAGGSLYFPEREVDLLA
jgi:flagellar hook-length control protein FliK